MRCKMNFNDLKQRAKMSSPQLADYFNIPYRTVANWASGERSCPPYLLELMEYKLKKEGIINEKNS